MKINIGKISIILWLVTAIIFGVFFVKGSTTKSTDNRRAIILSPSEKDLVLAEMRTLLKAVSGVIHALSENDMKKAAESATSAGMGMAVDVNPILMAKLPLDFKSLGMGTHRAFDELAFEIKSGATSPAILKSLGRITNRCIACHDTNRLTN
jgi:hypothetical protein